MSWSLKKSINYYLKNSKEEFSIGAKSLDDIMYDEETRRYGQAFEG